MSYKEIHLPSSVKPRAVTVPQAEDQAEGGEYRGLQHRRPRGGGVQVARQGRDEDGGLTGGRTDEGRLLTLATFYSLAK